MCYLSTDNIIPEGSTEIVSQAGDFLVDSLCDNELIKRIPVVGFAISLYKFGKSISDNIFLYKLRKFIDNLDSVDETWKTKYSNEEECKKIARQVVYIIDSFTDERKIVYFSKIFCHYVKGNLSKEDFLIVSNILCKSNLDYLYQVRLLDGDKTYTFMDFERAQQSAYYHLIYSGLMEETPGLMEFGNKYRMNKYGLFFKALFHECGYY